MQSKSITPYQSQYYAWQLTRRAAPDSVDSLASTLVNSQVDLNPHQVDAALFACQNPLSRGVILADEVGLGKTIEAGLVISQRWAERRRKVLIIVPANLRKQWHQELQDKFSLQATILEAKNFNALRKTGQTNPFVCPSGPVICSYQFAKSKAKDIKAVAWDLVVMDEAHRLRNVHKKNNVIGKTLKDALFKVHSKVLLTATPLQNSLLELYGLVSMIDDRVFGDSDSFRAQFATPTKGQTFEALRHRLAPLCKRTLRRQVQPYVSYTARRAIVQEFTPTNQEREFSNLVADYLRRPNLQAMPEGQRHLISLVLWKLLASSSRAIAGALDTMAKRLQGMLDETPDDLDIIDQLDQDYEALDQLADESGSDEDAPDQSHPENASQRQAIATEIDELRHFKQLAMHIQEDAKGQALFTALARSFIELERLGAPQKAIIFTESRRTQDYLLNLLAGSAYGDGIVLFNGTNNDQRAQVIYKNWIRKHQGTDRITGSKTADTRAALVDYFRDEGRVMIATEAGAEGINLQFCSLVINYDLPWNPQRIEQRIGRCHRYGQKFDVVVVNFVDRTNEADARVYQLLAEKFQLFEGVFGASDEVLGAVGSGVDFERRIADIYQNCRNSQDIKASFEQLQLDLKGEIDEAIVKTRQVLLENFDEEVQDKLRLRAEDSRSARGRFEQMLMALTEAELADCAQFDVDGFDLHRTPEGLPTAELGRYELPRRTGQAHIYKPDHPLAEWAIKRAKARQLPHGQLQFDYSAYGNTVSSLKPFRGQGGWLTVKLVTVHALGTMEQRLVVAATTHAGQTLLEDIPEKLLRLPARTHTPRVLTAGLFDAANQALVASVQDRKDDFLRDVNRRNLSHFEKEVEKLDAWADDLKLGLEKEIKAIDLAIKEVRRSAGIAATLEDKLIHQKHQRTLEAKRTQLRRELFTRQDDIEAQRNELIEGLEVQLGQQVEEQTLFSVEWSLR
jgi:hypothetical protein